MPSPSVMENYCQLTQASPKKDSLRQSASVSDVFILGILGDFQFVIRVENCGIRFCAFCVLTIRARAIFVNAHSERVNGNVSEPLIHPSARVVIVDVLFFLVHRFMGVAAKNPTGFMKTGVEQSARRHFVRHTQPTGVDAVDETGYRLAFKIKPLQLQIEQRAEIIQAKVIGQKPVELMTMNGQVAQAAVFPYVLLIDAHADEMRHDVGEALIVIAFDPNYFQPAFRIGKFANESEEFPMFFSQTAEIKVCEDIAQQNQSLETIFL